MVRPNDLPRRVPLPGVESILVPMHSWTPFDYDHATCADAACDVDFGCGGGRYYSSAILIRYMGKRSGKEDWIWG